MPPQVRHGRESGALQRLKPARWSVLAAGLKPGPPKTLFAGQAPCSPKTKRMIQRLALLLSVAFVLASAASARTLKTEKFSAEIFVEPDSSLNVNETIEANFI